MKDLVREYVILVKRFYAKDISMDEFWEAISQIDIESVPELESLQELIEHDIGYKGSVEVVYRELNEIEKKFL